MHNVLAADGTPPETFRATAREQLKEYSSVETARGRVESVTGTGDDFTVTFPDGCTEQARRIVLATGAENVLPEVPGLAELWGLRAFTCPFCDGHESAGRRIGVLGASARTGHLLGMLAPIIAGADVFPLAGEEADAQARAEIERRGGIVHEPVTAVAPHADGVRVTAGAATIDAAGLFVAAGEVRQRAPFAEQLGVRMLPSGSVEVDEFGRTSVAGVSAAGDLAHRPTLPGPMASVVSAMAAGQMAAAGIVQELSV